MKNTRSKENLVLPEALNATELNKKSYETSVLSLYVKKTQTKVNIKEKPSHMEVLVVSNGGSSSKTLSYKTF